MSVFTKAYLQDHEAVILGSILVRPSILERIELSPEDFSYPLYGRIYSGILELKDQGQVPDAAALCQHINSGVDPAVYTELMDRAAIPGHAVGYAEVIKLNSIKSQLSQIIENSHSCHELVENVQSVTSSYNLSQPRHGNVTTQVRGFVDEAEGVFTTTDVYNHLTAQDSKTKATIRKCLGRLRQDGLIELVGSRAGQYRKIQQQFETFDIASTLSEPFDFELPFNLAGSRDSLVELNPREIVFVAGQSNAGKTTMLVHTLSSFLLSLNAFKSKDRAIRYCSSEMGPAAMARKVRLYGEEAFRLWCEHVEIIGLSGGYQDAILPDGITFIDYIEPPEGDHTLMAHTLKQIHDKLNTGIAILAGQLRPGSESPEGGWGMIAKPRLVLLLKNVKGRLYQTVEIQKAKHPLHGPVNGKCLDFVVKSGSHLQAISPWGYESQLKQGRMSRDYVERQPTMPTFRRGREN